MTRSQRAARALSAARNDLDAKLRAARAPLASYVARSLAESYERGIGSRAGLEDVLGVLFQHGPEADRDRYRVADDLEETANLLGASGDISQSLRSELLAYVELLRSDLSPGGR